MHPPDESEAPTTVLFEVRMFLASFVAWTISIAAVVFSVVFWIWLGRSIAAML